MVKEWVGPTEESIAAERDGWELSQKFHQVAMLNSKTLDWAPDVDVFDNYKTSLRIDRFGASSENRKELEDTVRMLASLGIINSVSAATIDSSRIRGWTLLLPVENINRQKLANILEAQSQAELAASIKFTPEI